ncbi:hypothetical protein Tco_1203373 [Tanacetum coccineum]
MADWIVADYIIKSWIFLIFSEALQGELRVIILRDLSVDVYFHKIESIVTLFNDIGSAISNDDVVIGMSMGLEPVELKSELMDSRIEF